MFAYVVVSVVHTLDGRNARASYVKSINLFYEFIVINHSRADFIYGFSPKRNINSIRQLNGCTHLLSYTIRLMRAVASAV